MTEAAAPVPPLNSRFIAHLEAGGAVLTATRRQARLIRRLFDDAQVLAGRRVWPTAEVLPLQSWAAAQWQELAGHDSSLPFLLDEAQAAWPWRRLADGFIDAALLDAHDLANAARRAWISLYRHGGSLELLDRHVLTGDQRQFLGWARAVESSLLEAGWLDQALIEPALAAQTAKLTRRTPLLLAGLHAGRPWATDRLIESLGQSGWSVEVASTVGATGRVFGCRAADPAAEALAIVAWARCSLQANPRGRLAVIVPDLQERRAELERRFASVLQPELEMPGSLERDRLFDFAGGPPLSSCRVAEAALDCLQAGEPGLAHDGLSRLLRCRYVDLAGEDEARTRLDIQLRRQSLPHRPVRSVVRQARQGNCPSFALALEAAHRELHSLHDRLPADQWAAAFGAALGEWGWPGAGPLGSDEFQAAQEVRERLDSLAALARCAPLLSFAAARNEFARLLSAPFQPERGDAAVVVFDALEPTGIAFDGLWVAGMSAGAWPKAAAQDPFLPVSLQDELGMPGVTAERALAEAVNVTDAWVAGAGEVTFSWPLRQDDAVVEPSRVLPAALEEAPPYQAGALRESLAFDAGGLEEWPGDEAPALTAAETGGGSRVLDLQAKCPFRAFAELRLGARPLEEPAGGIDPRGRGNVLHRALELIWRTLGTQEALTGSARGALVELVEVSLAQALREELPADVGRRALALEADWQRLAIGQLLDFERSRPAFAVVAIEETREETFAGLRLRLRADRIDRVGDDLVIIDYKTGKVETSQWRGARPDAPQLPLYAALQPGGVGAIAFAAVGAQAATFKGVGAGDGIVAGIAPAAKFLLTEDRQSGFTWQEIQDRWGGWLTSLARDYLAGNAAVDPKQPQTCRLCHLSTLCRVVTEADADAEDAGDE
jgi:ATP-dependent helicase/nuclease subunit B